MQNTKKNINLPRLLNFSKLSKHSKLTKASLSRKIQPCKHNYVKGNNRAIIQALGGEFGHSQQP